MWINLCMKVKKKREVRVWWVKVWVFIIDEISMIDGEFFDKFEFIVRCVKGRVKGLD